MTDVIIARALHVLAVVIWIGGVSMATTVALPGILHGDLGKDRLQTFEAFEHRFAWQARTAIIIVGLTGFYMIERLDLWAAFGSPMFWWLHAMVGLWLLFAAILFVAEPLILRRHLHSWSAKHPEKTLHWLYRVHLVLLALSLITIFGAVVGTHG